MIIIKCNINFFIYKKLKGYTSPILYHIAIRMTEPMYEKIVDYETDITSYKYGYEKWLSIDNRRMFNCISRINWMFKMHKEGELSDDAFLYGVKEEFIDSQCYFKTDPRDYEPKNYNKPEIISPYYQFNKSFYENLAEWTRPDMLNKKRWLFNVAHVYNKAKRMLYSGNKYIYLSKLSSSSFLKIKLCDTFNKLMNVLKDICEFVETNYEFILSLDEPFMKDKTFVKMIKNMEYNKFKKDINQNKELREKYWINYQFELAYGNQGFHPLSIVEDKKASIEMTSRYHSHLIYANESKRADIYKQKVEIKVYFISIHKSVCYDVINEKWINLNFMGVHRFVDYFLDNRATAT